MCWGENGGGASVPKEQTCVFIYAATRQVACARNCARFCSDAGMSARARGAVDSIAATEVRRQEGRTGTAGISQSTCQRCGLQVVRSSVTAILLATGYAEGAKSMGASSVLSRTYRNRRLDIHTCRGRRCCYCCCLACAVPPVVERVGQ